MNNIIGIILIVIGLFIAGHAFVNNDRIKQSTKMNVYLAVLVIAVIGMCVGLPLCLKQ